MRIEKLHCAIVKISQIDPAKNLDPIRVIIEDYGCGGRIIIECFGRAWSCFWQDMGMSLASFFLQANVDYLEGWLHHGRSPSARDRYYLKRIIVQVKQAMEKSFDLFQPQPIDSTVETSGQ